MKSTYVTLLEFLGASFDENYNFNVEFEWVLRNVRVPCIKIEERALALYIQGLNI